MLSDVKLHYLYLAYILALSCYIITTLYTCISANRKQACITTWTEPQLMQCSHTPCPNTLLLNYLFHRFILQST